MLTFSDRKTLMSTVSDATEATRRALVVLVNREEAKVGSRACAVTNIAKLIGTSPSWLKKFLARSPEISEPRLSLFFSIRKAYEALCGRIEQEHQNEMAQIALLWGKLDAVDQGFVELVEGTARAPQSGK